MTWSCANCGDPVELDAERAATDPDSARCAACEPRESHGLPVEFEPPETPWVEFSRHPRSRLVIDDEVDNPQLVETIAKAEDELASTTDPEQRKIILSALSYKTLKAMGYRTFQRQQEEIAGHGD